MVTELTKREDGLGFTVDTHNFSESRSAVPMANTEDLFCRTSSYSLALTKRQNIQLSWEIKQMSLSIRHFLINFKNNFMH